MWTTYLYFNSSVHLLLLKMVFAASLLIHSASFGFKWTEWWSIAFVGYPFILLLLFLGNWKTRVHAIVLHGTSFIDIGVLPALKKVSIFRRVLFRALNWTWYSFRALNRTCHSLRALNLNWHSLRTPNRTLHCLRHLDDLILSSILYWDPCYLSICLPFHVGTNSAFYAALYPQNVNEACNDLDPLEPNQAPGHVLQDPSDVVLTERAHKIPDHQVRDHPYH